MMNDVILNPRSISTQSCIKQIRKYAPNTKCLHIQAGKRGKSISFILFSFTSAAVRRGETASELFKEGDWIFSDRLEIEGQIKRCGANHVICVTEEGYMFKDFII